MRNPWIADRHPLGWAVYRQGRGAREAYRLPSEPNPVTFERQGAAAVWAQILNEFAALRR